VKQPGPAQWRAFSSSAAWPAPRETVSSKFSDDLEKFENTHKFFALIDEIQGLAAQGEFNETRFVEFRNCLLARAWLEQDAELVAVLNHVGEAAFGLRPMTPEEAFRGPERSLYPGRPLLPMDRHDGEVWSMGNQDSQKPHLPLARAIANRHLTAAVWSILFSRRDYMTKEAFSKSTAPYLKSIVSDVPTKPSRPGVQSQAEADNAFSAMRSYFDSLELNLRSSCTVFNHGN
jgi:hypothetical protein